MRMRLMITLVVLMAFVLPLVSSSIFIDPLNEVYNYGDQLNVQTKIVPAVTTSGHYVVDLKCGNVLTINVFNSFFEISGGVERPVIVTTEILNPLLANVTNACFLRATYSGETVDSNPFDLSNKINLGADLAFDELGPGKYLSVTGTAIKESNVPVEGFVELFVKSLNLYKSSTFSNGIFNLSLMLPTNVKSGKHDMIIEVHNTDHNSRKINFGFYNKTFTVVQILKEIKIVVNNENVDPNTDFVFSVNAFDQAMDPIKRDVSISVNEPKGLPFIKKVIKSGEPQNLKFLFNNTPGYWSIETTVEGLSERKLFYLSEIQKVQTSLIDDTLFVTNVGNSPYSGPLEITIGSHVEVKQIKLGIGETQKFTLHAPDGDYSISISDGTASESLGNTFLTGNAVKVTDLREDVIGTITNPLIWWLAVILFILIIILVQVRLRLRKQPPAPMASNAMESKPLSIKNDFTFGSSSFDLPKKDVATPVQKPTLSKNTFTIPTWPAKQPTRAPETFARLAPAPVAVKVAPSILFGDSSHGIREHAVAVALYAQGNSNINPIVTSALSIAQESGAKIYVDGDYRIILFSPRLSHNANNEVVAVNVGRRIQALFLEYAKDHNDGLVFGIGISDGEIISEIENGKFHFTSTGNLISFAKRIAHSSNMRLFLSDSVRRKVITTVKTDKSPFQGIWEVTRVIDRSGSRDFINRFSDRNR